MTRSPLGFFIVISPVFLNFNLASLDKLKDSAKDSGVGDSNGKPVSRVAENTLEFIAAVGCKTSVRIESLAAVEGSHNSPLVTSINTFVLSKSKHSMLANTLLISVNKASPSVNN